MLIKTLVTPSKHGFAVCVIFDVENDANGELIVKNKQFVVIGPDGSVHVPQDNTFSAAVAMRNDLDDDKDSTPSSTTFSPG
ncbi:MAG: hypothetical protein ACYCR3_08220 [Acidithiobacillus sp.]